MKIDGYKLLCEFFSKRPDEKIFKSYPFISVEIYKGSKLETRKRLLARLIVTDKRLIVDRLGTFIAFPILAPKAPRKFDIQDLEFFYKKVKEVEIPYEYLSGVSYDENLHALKIETLLDKNVIFIKGRNIEKISNEVIDYISKLVKKYKHLAVR